MVTLDLSSPADNEHEFLVRRAQAIQAYATIEGSLERVFAQLLGCDPEDAAHIFFQITNTSSRTSIISGLIERRCDQRYHPFWNGIPRTPDKKGLWNIVRDLDLRRNQIVHWHQMLDINVDKVPPSRTVYLVRPAAWQSQDVKGMVSSDEMREFTLKADFASRSMNMFCAFLAGQMDEASKRTWREICRRPCIYPPPPNHPLAPTKPAPQNPPQSSRA
jgi:hypothetical protein